MQSQRPTFCLRLKTHHEQAFISLPPPSHGVTFWLADLHDLLVAHNSLCSICLALVDRYIRVMQWMNVVIPERCVIAAVALQPLPHATAPTPEVILMKHSIRITRNAYLTFVSFCISKLNLSISIYLLTIPISLTRHQSHRPKSMSDHHTKIVVSRSHPNRIWSHDIRHDYWCTGIWRCEKKSERIAWLCDFGLSSTLRFDCVKQTWIDGYSLRHHQTLTYHGQRLDCMS